MAKNNFKAKEATGDANYAQNVGSMGQDAMGTGQQQQSQGFQNLQDTFGAQKNFASMLQDAAAGKGGPSLADQQITDATARNNANAAGFAAGAKGLSPALAARQALMAQAGNNQQAAGQAAQTRIQEQQAARAQLGGALAGQAATAGGETSAGQGMFGTGGGLANQSNANLVQSRQGANQINADVAKQNAGAINGMIGGVMNAAGGAFGLAEGGVVPGEPEGTQNPETEMALASGGMVPRAPSLPSHVSMPSQPRRSFAAQVAHHLAREYFDEGGTAGHEPYQFAPMDLRTAKGHAKPKTESGADTTMFIPHDYHPSQPTDSREGTDSEGKAKPSINRAFGGPAAEQSYDETDDDPEADNEPDTDQSIDPGEAQEHGYYAEGGETDESAGLDTSKTPEQIVSAGKPGGPSARQRIGAGLSAMGSSMGGGPAAFKLSDIAKRQAAPAAPVTPSPLAAPTVMPAPQPQPVVAPVRPFADGGSVEREGAHYALRPGETPAMFHAHMDALAKKTIPSPAQIRRDDARPLPVSPETAARISENGPTPPGAGSRTWAHGGSKGGPSGKFLRTDIPVKEPQRSFETGGGVPGKAQIGGDSLKNDVVDAKLSPGEVVLPRTISHDPEKSKQFVQHLMTHGSTGHEALSAIKKPKGKR